MANSSNVIIEPEQQDYFDLLPDPILVLIFNKLLDAKSLCSSLLVSKRFGSLVPEVDSISIQMSSRQLNKSGSRSGSFLRVFVSKFIRFLHPIMRKKSSSSRDGVSGASSGGFDVVQWIGTALKNFKQIQSLKLELPSYGGETGVNKTSTPLLRWEAEFGKELDRCVILGATSIVERGENAVGSDDRQLTSEEDEPVFSDEELKLRIIWIISCLIASSGRHNLMKKVVNSCPNLSNAVISDAGKQGKLSMNAGQIRELRDSMEEKHTSKTNNPSESDSNSQMGYVGNLVMKLWYVKEMELESCGKVIKGATMVVIKPDSKVGHGGGRGEEEMGSGFEGDQLFGEAARELLRKKERRVYRLEMNTF